MLWGQIYTQRLVVLSPKVATGVLEHVSTHVLFACSSPNNPVDAKLQEETHYLVDILANIEGLVGQISTHTLLVQ